jgi:hypothetical protein
MLRLCDLPELNFRQAQRDRRLKRNAAEDAPFSGH